MELLTISDSLSAQQALEYGALQLVAAEVPPGLLAAPIAQGERLLLCRLLLDATWHSPAASIAARLEAFNTRGSTSEHKLLARTFELSELISSYFPDHFIIPTNSWMWRLNSSTPIVIPPTARHMPNSHALEEAAVPLGFSAEEYNGVLLASFAAGPISFPALVEFVAVLRALGAQLAHGARALLFNVPAGACALQLPPGAPSELQALWASALDELVELSHSYLTCAVLQGALSPPAVELALACRSRVALGGGAPALALSLGAWRDNSKRLPSARVWQLVRSLGIGAMARLLFCDATATTAELINYGMLDGVVSSIKDAADALLQPNDAPTATAEAAPVHTAGGAGASVGAAAGAGAGAGAASATATAAGPGAAALGPRAAAAATTDALAAAPSAAANGANAAAAREEAQPAATVDEPRRRRGSYAVRMLFNDLPRLDMKARCILKLATPPRCTATPLLAYTTPAHN
jgi:hypothetical protein